MLHELLNYIFYIFFWHKKKYQIPAYLPQTTMFLALAAIVFASIPDSFARLSVREIVTKNGYPVEVHHVTTSDGYILTLHRIPHGRTSNAISTNPVLIQHGLFLSSAVFLLSAKALGFLLADRDYDVWLGNFRGNFESRNHTSLNPDRDSKFWHFSWHEMGTIDLPTTIDYILNITQQRNLYYVGHSQGTTSFYVMAAMCPEYNSKIRVQVSLSPVAYLGHMPNLILSNLAKLIDSTKTWLEWFGMNELLSNTGSFTRTGSAMCKFSDLTCKLFFMMVFVFPPSQLEKTPLTLLAGYFSAGASVRQVAHFGQLIKSGYFRQYDFGDMKNKEKYGSDKPPSYNLTLVTAPCYLFHSPGDRAVAEGDVIRLCQEMGNCAGNFRIADDSFNHMDYVIGINAQNVLYPQVIDVLSKY